MNIEKYVPLIGQRMVAKSKQFNWWTTDLFQAKWFDSKEAAEDEAKSVINLSGFSIEALLPLVSVVKVTIMQEVAK